MAFFKLWSMACGKIHILATQLIYLFFVRSRCYDESSTRDYCTCHITHCWVPLGCPSKIQKVTLGRKVGSLRMRNVFKGKTYKNRSMFGMKYDIVRLFWNPSFRSFTNVLERQSIWSIIGVSLISAIVHFWYQIYIHRTKFLMLILCNWISHAYQITLKNS